MQTQDNSTYGKGRIDTPAGSGSGNSMENITVYCADSSIPAYVTVLIWRWNYLAGIVLCAPTYVVMLNLAGFMTLPLYAMTPEVRTVRQAEKELFSRH